MNKAGIICIPHTKKNATAMTMNKDSEEEYGKHEKEDLHRNSAGVAVIMRLR